MFTKTHYFFGLIYLLILTSCAAAEISGIKTNISGGSSSVSQNAANFSQVLELTSNKELENWLQISGVFIEEGTGVKLHLSLQDSGNVSPEGGATYKGELSIEYTTESDIGKKENHEFIMKTGSGDADTQYNYVYLDKDGSFVWKAFFADEFGSVLIILTQGNKSDECSANDGCNNEVFFSMADGAIYYRNWPDRGNAPLPPKNCWLVTAGPYDCRTWKTNTGIDITKAVKPDGSAKTLSGNKSWCFVNVGEKQSPCDNGAYIKLATFKDLDFKILFQIDSSLTSVNLKPSQNLLAIKNAGKALRGTASISKKNPSVSLLPKILLMALSFIFLGLLLVVFFRKQNKTK